MNDHEMRKLAAQQLRSLSEENTKLAAKVAASEKKDRCIKIALKMVDKGLLRDNVEDFLAKVAQMETNDNLDQLDAAVDIAVQGFRMGEASSEEKTASESASDPFTALVLESMASQS